MPWPSRKNSRFSGKEQTETREVHLLVVRFDLREIGIDGEVRNEAFRDPVLRVETHVGVEVVLEGNIGVAVGPHRARRVRLELEIEGAHRRLDPDECPRVGKLRNAPHAKSSRDRRQVAELVLRAYDPTEVDPPNLALALLVAKRFERDRELDRPAFGETGRFDVPHRVPVRVDVALASNLSVVQRAERIGVEQKAVATIVERVENDGEIVVVKNAASVASQLVGHDLLGVGVPVARRHVDVLVIEEDPDFGFLSRRLALVRLLLDESADGWDAAVDVLLEPSIQGDRGLERYRAQRNLAIGVARDDFRGCRRRGVRRCWRRATRFRHRSRARGLDRERPDRPPRRTIC